MNGHRYSGLVNLPRTLAKELDEVLIGVEIHHLADGEWLLRVDQSERRGQDICIQDADFSNALARLAAIRGAQPPEVTE